MAELDGFTRAFLQLCYAFGKPIAKETLREYFKAFEELTEEQLTQLVRWAIDNLDTPFPRIAVLRQYAAAQGWYGKAPSIPDPFVHVVCNDCGGAFVIKRSQLEQDAAAGRTYRCTNSLQWHCPAFFSAQTLLSKEDL
jgi:hypothetical protein